MNPDDRFVLSYFFIVMGSTGNDDDGEVVVCKKNGPSQDVSKSHSVARKVLDRNSNHRIPTVRRNKTYFYVGSKAPSVCSISETNQIEDPRQQWRKEQEHMLKDYLVTAQEDLAVGNHRNSVRMKL